MTINLFLRLLERADPRVDRGVDSACRAAGELVDSWLVRGAPAGFSSAMVIFL
jgi:hypothetical protein